MFKNIFKKDKKKETPTAPPENDLINAAFFNAIKEAKKKDPLAGLKMGADEINARLFDAIKNDKGVNVDIALRILSALAGFSCQMSIREAVIKTGKASEKEAFTIVNTKNGDTYYMGGLLNAPLIDSKMSVWSLVGGAIQQVQGELPDLKEIASYGASTVGDKNFGKPRVDEKHLLGEPSQNYVQALWPKLSPIIDRFCDNPTQRPILLGIALYKLIIQAKDVIDPKTAGILCMDTAVAMSKIDPKRLNIDV